MGEIEIPVCRVPRFAEVIRTPAASMGVGGNDSPCPQFNRPWHARPGVPTVHANATLVRRAITDHTVVLSAHVGEELGTVFIREFPATADVDLDVTVEFDVLSSVYQYLISLR